MQTVTDIKRHIAEGGGGQAQVDACGDGAGVKPHVDVHTEN